MPAKDPSRDGLLAKYFVSRIDGKPMGWCFVLEESDPATPSALHAYATAVKDTHPELARDLFIASMKLRTKNVEQAKENSDNDNRV
ncbi:sulfatase-modifying factor enzyme [Gordonia phage Kvothe]|uniref:Uncharacterized protein n=1 Tax=Gordonia phage Kvothe TaxID=1838071 RepID=A0A160DGQ0_9CAUD|nr:sulfatase-modifying factor enzyme [Gordonia phage Kvothe]ANA86114.1 hypothetical protein PBI_KVOTHE_50 [Gordonia phage Kvothe]UYL87071.1 hypothetical protein SEA_HOLLOW_51 [Gordonia phage Hollow]